MTSQWKCLKWACVSGAVAVGILVGGKIDSSVSTAPSFISQAEARIDRPLTARSVAGVARRTTRRVVRRSAIYVAALPAACAKVTVNGASYWSCGGVYYQRYSGRFVVVYVN
jgi:hypothetical protein